jgi:hypothetical protein
MKIQHIFGFLALGASLSFGAEIPNKPNNNVQQPVNSYAPFQLFDSQFNFGLGLSHGTTAIANSGFSGPVRDKNGQIGTYNNNYDNLQIEKLFDIGVWFLVDGTLVNSYSQSKNQSQVAGQQSGNNITGNNPFFGGISAKVGYAFPFNDSILVTPYGQLARSTNMSSFALDNISAGENNLTQSYFNTLGYGFRVEVLAIQKYLELYIDENLHYNFSQTPIADAVYRGNPSYGEWASTIGLKWRVAYNFQIGANYTFSYDVTQDTLSNRQDSNPMSQTNYYQPATNSAYMLTFGFNY